MITTHFSQFPEFFTHFLLGNHVISTHFHANVRHFHTFSLKFRKFLTFLIIVISYTSRMTLRDFLDSFHVLCHHIINSFSVSSTSWCTLFLLNQDIVVLVVLCGNPLVRLLSILTLFFLCPNTALFCHFLLSSCILFGVSALIHFL